MEARGDEDWTHFNILLRSRPGNLEELLARINPPNLVIQTLVAFDLGALTHMCM